MRLQCVNCSDGFTEEDNTKLRTQPHGQNNCTVLPAADRAFMLLIPLQTILTCIFPDGLATQNGQLQSSVKATVGKKCQGLKLQTVRLVTKITNTVFFI